MFLVLLHTALQPPPHSQPQPFTWNAFTISNPPPRSPAPYCSPSRRTKRPQVPPGLPSLGDPLHTLYRQDCERSLKTVVPHVPMSEQSKMGGRCRSKGRQECRAGGVYPGTQGPRPAPHPLRPLAPCYDPEDASHKTNVAEDSWTIYPALWGDFARWIPQHPQESLRYHHSSVSWPSFVQSHPGVLADYPQQPESGEPVHIDRSPSDPLWVRYGLSWRAHRRGSGLRDVDTLGFAKTSTPAAKRHRIRRVCSAAATNTFPVDYLITTLQHITIFVSLAIKDAHRVLRAFPALRTFDLPFFTPSRNMVLESSSEETMTHPLVEQLSSSSVASWTLLKVCFPKVRKVATFNNFTNFIALLDILRMSPGLEKLHVLNIYAAPEHFTHNSTATVDQGDVQLRSISIQNHPWYPFRMTQLLARAPHLVKLEVCFIPREAIGTIARTCRNMEQLQFHVTQRCPNEIHQLLVECQRLKSLQGQGLAVTIDDILLGPSWTCLGLRIFQCGIMGVPRLSSEEETFLKCIKRNSLSNDDIEKEQRIQEKQQESWATQEQVLRYLAQFKNLQHLDIGFVRLPCRQRHKRWICTLNQRHYRMSNIPVPDSLEMSMASGLAQLSTLSRLETFGFKEVDHRIGENELRWIAEHWTLKRVYGFGG